MNSETEKRFRDAVHAHLYPGYKVAGEPVTGQALSFLHSSLREAGWRNLGNLHDFYFRLQELGFKIADKGRNSRGGRCQVVHL